MYKGSRQYKGSKREGVVGAGAVLALSCTLDTAERYRRGMTQEEVDAWGEVFPRNPYADLTDLVPWGTLDLSGSFRKRLFS